MASILMKNNRVTLAHLEKHDHASLLAFGHLRTLWSL